MSGLLMLTRIKPNTFLHNKSEFVGLQSVLFVPRVEHTPLQDVGNELLICLAVMVKPL